MRFEKIVLGIRMRCVFIAFMVFSDVAFCQNSSQTIGQVTFDIDTIYEASDLTDVLFATEYGDKIMIAYLREDKGGLQIALDTSIEVGAYILDTNQLQLVQCVYIGSSNEEPYSSFSGQLVVTLHDKENNIIQGFFDCGLRQLISQRTRIITNGYFELEY